LLIYFWWGQEHVGGLKGDGFGSYVGAVAEHDDGDAGQVIYDAGEARNPAASLIISGAQRDVSICSRNTVLQMRDVRLTRITSF
jgi:hypothetical protein